MDMIVIKKIRSTYIVKDNEKEYTCRARGVLRGKTTILVGDKVELDEEYVISNVLGRKNQLIRPEISNIDQALIVVSVTRPEFSTYMLDKTLDIIEYNNIVPIICITKMDLLEDNKDIEKYIKYYKKIGYKVILNTDKKEITDTLKNKVTVLIGQSGVGKSTLLNFLDKNLKLLSADISERLGRGKNTTRHVELLEVCDGLVADTPGFSALNFIGMTKSDIRDNMVEFNLYKDKCKYKDCMHIKEIDCEIKNMVEKGKILKSRYENYIKFLE
jgi:ribosome biogenesis GTPase